MLRHSKWYSKWYSKKLKFLQRRGMTVVVLSILVGLLALILSPLDQIFAQGNTSLFIPFASSGPDTSIIPNQYIVVLQDASVANVSALDEANALTTRNSQILYSFEKRILYGICIKIYS